MLSPAEQRDMWQAVATGRMNRGDVFGARRALRTSERISVPSAVELEREIAELEDQVEQLTEERDELKIDLDSRSKKNP